jgi:hypothetical protein
MVCFMLQRLYSQYQLDRRLERPAAGQHMVVKIKISDPAGN